MRRRPSASSPARPGLAGAGKLVLRAHFAAAGLHHVLAGGGGGAQVGSNVVALLGVEVAGKLLEQRHDGGMCRGCLTGALGFSCSSSFCSSSSSLALACAMESSFEEVLLTEVWPRNKSGDTARWARAIMALVRGWSLHGHGFTHALNGPFTGSGRELSHCCAAPAARRIASGGRPNRNNTGACHE